jgi:hypothetical protein
MSGEASVGGVERLERLQWGVPSRQSRRSLCWVTATLWVALFAVIADRTAARPAAQTAVSPCDIRTTERVVAVGDVHGAYDEFVAILRAAGLIDRRERWSGGRAVFVQTGDVLDRGGESRKVVDLLQRLERDAPRAGGQVHALLGNHEFMRLVGDWRYVSTRELEAFVNPGSSALREQVYQVMNARAEDRAAAEDRRHDERAYREQFMKEVPLGFLEMRLAFEPKEQYGRWVRARHAAVRINDILFLHGGVSDTVAELGCEGINKAIRDEMASLPAPPEKIAALLATSETGPLWYRGLAAEPEETFAPALEAILQKVGARAIVIGHTPVPGRVATRFGGRVIQIDSGMLDGEFYPGGVASALELQNGLATAIYLDRRERIDTPALELAASTR